MTTDRTSDFGFLRSRYPQAAKDAERAEYHYSVTHDLKSAGSAIRCCLEGFLKQLHKQESEGRVAQESDGLRWLIDNVYAPRQGFNEMHAIRMLGNKSSHPGQAPGSDEIREHLTALHRILAANVPANERPPLYKPPARRNEPLDSARTSELEAKNARLLEERDTLERESALAREEREAAAQELATLNAKAEELARQKEADRLEVERLAMREEEYLSAQRKLEARMSELEQQLSSDDEEKRDLDAELARVSKEMEAQLRVHEWAERFPQEDWSAASSFVQDRLMAGQPPFQEWHIAPTLIGEGAFGRVYRCFPSNDGVPVAVKIPWGDRRRTGCVRSGRGECASARRVAAMFAEDRSPAVPRPLQVAPEGIDAFITYELVEGKQLGTLIGGARSRDPRWQLAPLQSLFIIDRLTETVDELLQAGVRHTDLSPRNVILRAPHDPVLIDYAPCVPGDTRPPEWTGLNPQNCPVELARSGQIYLLGSLLLRLLGIHRLPAAHSLLSSDVLDTQLVRVEGDDDWEPELASSISKRLENLELGAREELRDLLLDLLDPDPAHRVTMRFEAIREILRRAYDPRRTSVPFSPRLDPTKLPRSVDHPESGLESVDPISTLQGEETVFVRKDLPAGLAKRRFSGAPRVLLPAFETPRPGRHLQVLLARIDGLGRIHVPFVAHSADATLEGCGRSYPRSARIHPDLKESILLERTVHDCPIAPGDDPSPCVHELKRPGRILEEGPAALLA